MKSDSYICYIEKIESNLTLITNKDHAVANQLRADTYTIFGDVDLLVPMEDLNNSRPLEFLLLSLNIEDQKIMDDILFLICLTLANKLYDDHYLDEKLIHYVAHHDCPKMQSLVIALMNSQIIDAQPLYSATLKVNYEVSDDEVNDITEYSCYSESSALFCY